MYMEVTRGLHIRVLDSLNFLPMKLAALPKAFGLTELCKGCFPHFFNKRENQQYDLFSVRESYSRKSKRRKIKKK